MLKCLAINDEDSPNNVTFDWYKDDDDLPNNDSNIEIETSLSNSKLFIKQLDPKADTGMYSCRAYNNDTFNSVFTNTTLTIESELLLFHIITSTHANVKCGKESKLVVF